MLLSNYSSGSTNEDILEVGNYSLSCEGCLDYDDCPYHDPNDVTPYLDDNTIGCPFNLAKSK